MLLLYGLYLFVFVVLLKGCLNIIQKTVNLTVDVNYFATKLKAEQQINIY